VTAPTSTRLILEHLDEIRQTAGNARRILLLLDFDGTLAPIVESPGLAKLPEQTRSLIIKLNQEPRVTVAIISGRALSDLRQRIGLDLIYAGNHGLEIEGPGLHFQAPDLSHARLALDKAASDLAVRLQSVDGVLIENKGASLSIHYRRAAPSSIPVILSAVESACAPYAHLVELHHGKKVFEVRPNVKWNKGTAAQWILRQLGDEGILPVCIGDDKTDEDIFRALPASISIKVGDGPTAARYRVSSSDQVRDVLQEIYALVKQRDSAAAGPR